MKITIKKNIELQDLKKIFIENVSHNAHVHSRKTVKICNKNFETDTNSFKSFFLSLILAILSSDLVCLSDAAGKLLQRCFCMIK